jgi:predicted AlkP superfamily pyrophosphatase or phosphodiesterase
MQKLKTILRSSLIRNAAPTATFILLLIAFFTFDIPAQKRARVSEAKRALIISLDGLDGRYLSEPDKYNLRIPTLRRLMREGISSQRVISVYPTVTYPNHTTMVTGAYPARHGIFGNDLFEPPDQKQTRSGLWFARDIKAQTLWDAAKAKGLIVGLVSWPVAGGAGDFNVPEIWQPGGTFEQTLARMSENARPRGLIEEIAARDPALYRNATKDEQDDMRTRFAEYILREKKPNVMLVHLYDLDHFQHDFGPFTPESLQMLEKTDAYLARLLKAAEQAGTLNDTTIFITSDHGFLPTRKQLHPGVLLARAGLVRATEEKNLEGRPQTTITEWRAAPYVTGGACAIYLRDEKDEETLHKLRRIFDPAANPGNGILRVIEQSELRRLNSNTRAALMLEAAEGYTFGGNFTGEYITDTRTRGMHGYLPTRPDYRTSFIASGAGVKRRGNFGEIQMTQVGATIARVLGIRLRDAQGEVLRIK